MTSPLKLAEGIVRDLLELVRASQATPMRSGEVRQCAERLQGYFSEWLGQSETLGLEFNDRSFTLNELRPEVDFNSFILSVRYSRQWQDAGVQSLVFLKPLEARDLAKILLLPFHPKARGGISWIQAQLAKFISAQQIEFQKWEEPEPVRFFRIEPDRLLSQLVWVLGFALRQDPSSTEYDLAMLRLKRLCQALADSCVDAQELLPLIMFSPPRWPQLYSIVQTTILVVLFAHSLGLGRQLLVNLALTSLLHDIASAVAAAREETEIKRPDLEGICFLAARKRMDQALLQGLVISGELRRALGSDEQARKLPLHLFSRMIFICRAFVEKMRAGSSPYHALQAVLKNPDERMDASLLEWFSLLLGRMPVGTVVQLEGLQSSGIVCGHWQDQMGRIQPVVLPAGKNLSPFQAIATPPAVGDEQLPSVRAVSKKFLPTSSQLLQVLAEPTA